jgi:hypothetical protein
VSRVSTGLDAGPCLADPVLDERFRRDGYAVVPFVDDDTLAHLRERVEPLVPADGGPFFSLYRNDGPDLRRRLDEVIRAELAPLAEPHLQGQRFFMGSALVKFPGAGSYLALHQDWTFVDESRYVNGLVWLALEPTAEDNGGLHAVPGSHRLDLPWRGTPPGMQASEPVDELLKQRYLRRIDTRAGDAVLYHDALIHGSTMNLSDRPRIAIVVGFVSEDAPLVHFWVDGDGTKWRYTVADDFFFDYSPPGRPEGPAVLDVERWDSSHFLLGPEDLVSLPDAPGWQDRPAIGVDPGEADRSDGGGEPAPGPPPAVADVPVPVPDLADDADASAPTAASAGAPPPAPRRSWRFWRR